MAKRTIVRPAGGDPLAVGRPGRPPALYHRAGAATAGACPGAARLWLYGLFHHRLWLKLRGGDVYPSNGPGKIYPVDPGKPREQERRLQLLYQAEWALGERGDPASIYAYTYGEAAFARSLRTPAEAPGYLACPTLPVQVCHDREALLKGGWWAESLPEAPRHYGGAMSGLRGDMQIPAGGRVQVVLMLGQEAEAEAAERISRSTPSLCGGAAATRGSGLAGPAGQDPGANAPS